MCCGGDRAEDDAGHDDAWNVPGPTECEERAEDAEGDEDASSHVIDSSVATSSWENCAEVVTKAKIDEHRHPDADEQWGTELQAEVPAADERGEDEGDRPDGLDDRDWARVPRR